MSHPTTKKDYTPVLTLTTYFYFMQLLVHVFDLGFSFYPPFGCRLSPNHAGSESESVKIVWFAISLYLSLDRFVVCTLDPCALLVFCECGLARYNSQEFAPKPLLCTWSKVRFLQTVCLFNLLWPPLQFSLQDWISIWSRNEAPYGV